MRDNDDSAWFAPKRFGYGAGLPVRWQGWAVLLGYLSLLIPFHFLMQGPGAAPRALAIVMMLGATVVLVALSRAKTRGGWKWRWGGRD
ncbi:hypothetical protein ACFFF7_11535 [Novosphingobium aquiterrae]|uniref:Uncharacterized protein n=1 Tax=Novosphingobium aquiterrae TaxID=624388 RepID=A0ABV6PLU0_9SPHN